MRKRAAKSPKKSGMKKCDCSMCQRTLHFRAALDSVPEKDAQFWSDIFSALLNAESDRDYYCAIVDGSWPNADELIAKNRLK
jgi:hypothetical protein